MRYSNFISVNKVGKGSVGSNVSYQAAGELVSLSATPSVGYHFTEWIASDVTITNNSFIMPDHLVTVTAVFAGDVNDITVNADENGTASSDKASAATDDTVTLIAIPNDGYHFVEWESDDVAVNGSTFTMPATAVTVNAKFEAHTWDDGKLTAEPACMEKGVKTYTCTECAITKTEDVDPLGHNMVDNQCTVCGYIKGISVTPDTPADSEVSSSGDSSPFDDVPADAYYADAVEWAVENDIVKGISEKIFNPDGTCTRAQAVTFLWRAFGCPAPVSTEMPFADVSKDSYYHDAVLWAAERGITNGTSATTFSPNADCTRAQIVTFIFRYMNK